MPARAKGTWRERQPGHARPRAVTPFRRIPSVCSIIVAAVTRVCPRFPLQTSMVRRGRIRVLLVREWRTSGAHPSICRVLLSSLGCPNRRSSGRSRVSAALWATSLRSLRLLRTSSDHAEPTAAQVQCAYRRSPDCIQALARPRSESAPGAVGGEHDLAHASAPPICRG
jgi:hypothetical protein